MIRIMAVAVLLGILISIYPVATYAYDGGLFHGQLGRFSSGSILNPDLRGVLTDGDKETTLTLRQVSDSQNSFICFVPENVTDRLNIAKYRLDANAGSLRLHVHTSSSAYTSVTLVQDDTERSLVRNNITHVCLVNYSAANVTIREFDLFGEVVDLTPPAKPLGLTGSKFAGQITLNWTTSPEADLAGYNVYRNGVKINTALVTNTNYVDSNPPSDSELKYQVTAVDSANNESVKSDQIIVQTDDTKPPTIPTNISLIAGDKQVRVNWTNSTDPSGILGYNVFRDGSKINMELIETNTYLDQGLTNGITYRYQVSAVDTVGNESNRSIAVAVRPTSQMNVRLIPNKDSIVVQVTHGYPPYLIEWGSESIEVNASTFVIEGLEENQEYTVKVTDQEETSITQTVNTGSLKSYVPPVFPAPDSVFQSMINNFGGAGTIAIAIITAAVALGLICILGIYGWRLAKRWLSATR